MYRYYHNNNRQEENNYMIINEVAADVTNDGKLNNIQLIGSKPIDPNYPYYKNLHLGITDNNDDPVWIELPINKSFAPNIIYSNLSDDNTNNLMLTQYLGTTGDNVAGGVYNLKNNAIYENFSTDEFEKEYQYIVEFKDNYKVEIYNPKADIVTSIDISRNKLLKEKYYDSAGNVIRPTYGQVGFITGIGSMAYGTDGINRIALTQYVFGPLRTEFVGHLLTLLRGDNYTIETQVAT